MDIRAQNPYNNPITISVSGMDGNVDVERQGGVMKQAISNRMTKNENSALLRQVVYSFRL